MYPKASGWPLYDSAVGGRTPVEVCTMDRGSYPQSAICLMGTDHSVNLWHSIFKESIAESPPTTLEELLKKVEKYIYIEETAEVTTLWK